jgi:hypothetical protein
VPRIKLWLSDHAWDSLSREAFTLGWIRQMNTLDMPGHNSRYIARFFDALSVLEYEDVRPEQFEGTCVWCEGERTHIRNISIEQQPLNLLARIAIKHRIPPRWYASALFNECVPAALTQDMYASILANEHTTVGSLASAALEAIGCRYLAPPVYPAAPPGIFRNKPRGAPDLRYQRVSQRLGFG